MSRVSISILIICIVILGIAVSSPLAKLICFVIALGLLVGNQLRGGK